MATLKQRLHRKNADGGYDVVHLETSASVVMRADGSTSVEQSLTEIESWDLLKYEEAGDYAGMPYLIENVDAATLQGHPASDFVLAANANFAAASHTHTKAQITDFPTTMTPAAHTHGAGDITSGILSIARGGTGVASLAELATAIAPSLSGVKIQTGSYTGNGRYGSSNQRSLTFNFEPKLVICNATGDFFNYWGSTIFYRQSFIWFSGITKQLGGYWQFDSDRSGILYNYFTANGTTLNFYGDTYTTQISGVTNRTYNTNINDNNVIYYWVALG